MNCEICGTTDDLRSMQTARSAPVVLCRACAFVAGTDPRTVLALVDALSSDPAMASLFPDAPAGTVLIRTGEPGEEFFLIVEGAARVHVEGARG